MIGEFEYFAIGTMTGAVFWTFISVWSQRKYKAFTLFFGKLHSVAFKFFLAAAWFGFFTACKFLLDVEWAMTPRIDLGFLIMNIALFLIIWSIKYIGFGAIYYSNLFSGKVRELGGPYKYVKHPMYLGYALWLIGLGFFSGSFGFFILGPLLYFELMLIALVEKPRKINQEAKID